MEINSKSWDKVANNEEFHSDSSAFYQYKKRQLTNLIQKWAGNYIDYGKILKTDLIEEALREDDILFWLAHNNKDVFGMDISPKMTSYAKERSIMHNSKLKLAAADVRVLPYKNCSFDFIISNSTCDHFPEIDSALEELYRVLKPGGTLIITLHNKLDLTFWLFIILKKVFGFVPEMHFECCYTPADMQRRLSKTGFLIQDYATNLHLPFVLSSLITTLEKWSTGRNHQSILKINSKIAHYCDKISEKNKIFSHLFSSLIACKAVKNII